MTNKINIWALLALVFLLPIFFLPASILPLGIAKATFLAVAAIVAFLALALSILRNGGFELPYHHLLWAVVALPVVYLASALLSRTRDLSLFGYGMEVGTAVYMLVASALLVLTAMAFSDSAKIARALSAIFLSLGLLSVFALVKILTGGSFPVWGTFFGNMGNPAGSWADYAVMFGLLATMSVLALGFLNLSKMMRVVMYAFFGVSTLLLAVLNFSTAFVFTLLTSIVVLVYLLTVEKAYGGKGINGSEGGNGASKLVVWPAAVLCAVSLLFIINPVVSATYGTIGETVSGAFGVSNVDVRPSFMATLGISQAVYETRPLLGAGPNTFNQSWLLHKSSEINQSQFWNTSFPSGFGFIPTQASSVGILGSVAWILFFLFFIMLGYRALAHMPAERWERFMIFSTFLGALFLWLASFMYTPSIVVLTLAFILTGLFVGASSASGIIRRRGFSISRNIVLNFASVLVLVGLGIGSVALGFSVYQRTASAYHFQKALVLSNTDGASVDDIKAELLKAIRLVPADGYYSALAEINIARAQSALNATEGSDEENAATFQSSLSEGIAAAQAAVNANPSNYRNWVMLGSIYASLVPEPFSVEGSYESAKTAYLEAKKRNPHTPEVPVLLARLELDSGNADAARTHIEESLALKQDYANAYFLLTQLEIGENNIESAIRSAETSAILSPDNAGVFFQLGLLRYTNKDFDDAVAVFNHTLKILPEYANAKYFLGLSLAELGQSEESLAHFEELAKTNPDNEEIRLILENLKEGREPLAGIPSAESDVETRQSPPITEAE